MLGVEPGSPGSRAGKANASLFKSLEPERTQPTESPRSRTDPPSSERTRGPSQEGSHVLVTSCKKSKHGRLPPEMLMATARGVCPSKFLVFVSAP